MKRRSDDFRMNPITLGAVIGGLMAFVFAGGIEVMLWVAVAATVGAGIGWIVHLFARRANAYAAGEDLREHATKAELEAEAARLDIDRRSSMTKDELADAIVDKLAG